MSIGTMVIELREFNYEVNYDKQIHQCTADFEWIGLSLSPSKSSLFFSSTEKEHPASYMYTPDIYTTHVDKKCAESHHGPGMG